MSDKVKSIIKFLVFLGAGGLIFMLLYWNFEASYIEECAKNGIPESECSLLDKLITDFKSVKVVWILIIILIYMLSNIMRALRWNQLLNPLGYNPKFVNSLGALMIGYFTNLALPRVGEFVKTGSLSKNENIPFEKVMGTVVVDRILDFLALFLVIALALIAAFPTFQSYFRDNFQVPATTTFIALGALMLIGIIGLFFSYKLLTNKELKHPLLSKVRNIILGFKDGLLSLVKVKNKALLVFYSLGIWFCYYLMTYLCFWAFEPVEHLSPLAGLIIFVFGTLGMIFPSPGGMGSYHLLISQGLIIYGISGADAFSFSNIIFFAINIFGNILFGLFFLVLLPFYNKK